MKKGKAEANLDLSLAQLSLVSIFLEAVSILKDLGKQIDRLIFNDTNLILH